MKAIETQYNGYKFRSRLEARWAVFFDAIGMRYEYEPEGFEVDIGDKKIRYLPDFYLPELDVYAEVKPSKTKLLEDQEKLSWMVDYNGPMARGLLILGQIPHYESYIDGNEFVMPAYGILSWSKGVVYNIAKIAKVGHDDFCLYIEEYCSTFSAPELPYIGVVGEDLYINTSYIREMRHDGIWLLEKYFLVEISEEMRPAYQKAREARFEYGETPSLNL